MISRLALYALVGVLGGGFAEAAVSTVAGAGVRSAHADRVHSLARKLTSRNDTKTRISAAIALGRLKDRRALKPLVNALKDKSRVVRAVAATALGALANNNALPALQRATHDKDRLVRKRATEAMTTIRTRLKRHKYSNKHSNKYSNKYSNKKNRTSFARSTSRRRAGFGNKPHRLGAEPTMFVIIKSAADESKEKATSKTRKRRALQMRGYMMRELRNQGTVTTSIGEAAALGLAHNAIDVSITKLDRVARGKFMEIECEIRISISNERGKMLSFLTGGAKIQVPRIGFRTKYLPQLRKEAIENAVKSVHRDLIAHLKRSARS